MTTKKQERPENKHDAKHQVDGLLTAGDGKKVQCPDCGRWFYVYMKSDEQEFLDGWHGECIGPFCGYTYFEAT